jgi:opacity protein-like surface antigen
MHGVYVGASLDASGERPQESRAWGNSLTVGYQLTRNIAIEAVGSYIYSTSSKDAGQTGFVNLVAGQRFGQFTPYVVAGTGVGFNGAGDSNSNADALWNIGGGVSYHLTRNWVLDARYSYVDGWRSGRDAEHAVSLGVNYRF